MGQEFTVKSEDIENKINQLLPSQAGFGAGVDITASTTVIPIVDLTETAEGSLLRQDLQSSFGINSTHNLVQNAVTTIINTTGYFRLIGNYRSTGTTNNTSTIRINDGAVITNIYHFESTITGAVEPFDFIIILKAGQFCEVQALANCQCKVTSRQIADINGNLTDPS